MNNSLMDRTPPQNLEAEQSTLGSMMIDSTALNVGAGILQRDDFYRDAHSEIFASLIRLAEAREPVDIVTVQEDLRQHGKLESVGGTEYLMALIDSVPTAANIEYYSGIVRNKSKLRRIIDICALTISEAHGDIDNVEQVVENLTHRAMATYRDKEIKYAPLRDYVQDAFETIERWYHEKKQVSGIPFGIPSLDRITTGAQPGWYYLIGARPGEGKTAMMLQHIKAGTKAGYKCGLFSIEMSAQDLVLRLFCVASGVGSLSMRTGNIPDNAWGSIVDAATEISRMNVEVRDLEKQNVHSLPIIARQMLIRNKVDWFCLDYLQLVEGDSKHAKTQREQINQISGTIRDLCRELNKPWVVAAQLNRNNQSRDDSRPKLGDFKESGNLEQDAVSALLLNNPPPKEHVSIHQPRKAEIIIAKARFLPTAVLPVMWDGQNQKFFDIAEDADGEPMPEPDESQSRHWQGETWG